MGVKNGEVILQLQNFALRPLCWEGELKDDDFEVVGRGVKFEEDWGKKWASDRFGWFFSVFKLKGKILIKCKRMLLREISCLFEMGVKR